MPTKQLDKTINITASFIHLFIYSKVPYHLGMIFFIYEEGMLGEHRKYMENYLNLHF